MSLSQHTVAVALGTAAGLLCYAALAGDSSAGMLMAAWKPATVTRASTLVSSALESSLDERAYEADPGMPVEAVDRDEEATPLPSGGSWTPLVALGLIPVAIVGAVTLLHRRVTAALSPVEVDLEAGSTAGAPLFRSPVFPTGRRVAEVATQGQFSDSGSYYQWRGKYTECREKTKPQCLCCCQRQFLVSVFDK